MFGATKLPSTEANGMLRCIVDLQGLKLFIEQVTPETPSAPEPPYRGLEHLGLAVNNLDQAVSDLESKGAEFLVPPRTARPGIRIAFLRGPDNVRIELVERTAAE
ncbi:MAG: VOC family protein [Acetobacteraceae bacterium]|nr:VOC family protein [Acetobacteraceae bacterium]